MYLYYSTGEKVKLGDVVHVDIFGGTIAIVESIILPFTEEAKTISEYYYHTGGVWFEIEGKSHSLSSTLDSDIVLLRRRRVPAT
ncbi:MAG: hypothetical protein JEZ07_19240 [Phycisphaerae bacterium]|nr:hypothetical protein [Phycisphaerae bacterium]